MSGEDQQKQPTKAKPKRDLVGCDKCGRKNIYWDWAPNNWKSGGKEIPYWENGEPHFCFNCGAGGWGTEGCGKRVVKVHGRDGKWILVSAKSKGSKEHDCPWARKLKKKPERKKWIPPELRETEKEEDKSAE